MMVDSLTTLSLYNLNVPFLPISEITSSEEHGSATWSKAEIVGSQRGQFRYQAISGTCSASNFKGE